MKRENLSLAIIHIPSYQFGKYIILKYLNFTHLKFITSVYHKEDSTDMLLSKV